MTVKTLYPNVRPSFFNHFSKSKVLNPRFTYTRASSATYFDAVGALQEAVSNQPRFDYDPVTQTSLGLLIEAQRTNVVTNPRLLGAVAGTPGTQPTDFGSWNLSTSGLSIQIVQSITYNNLTGVRYRLFGTAAATATVSNLFSPSSSGFTASPGQNWTGSVFIAVASGLDTVNNFRLNTSARAGGGTAGSSTSGSLISSLSTTATRFSQTYTNLPGTTTGIAHQLLIGVTSGVAVDITFDVFGPQLEQGSCVTSLILPPGTTIAASTRSADFLSISLSTMGVGTTGTCSLVCNGMLPQSAPSGINQSILQVDDASDNNRYLLRNDAATSSIQLYRATSGSLTSAATVGAFTTRSQFKLGMTIDGAGGVVASMNGASVVSQTGGPTSGLTTLRLGGSVAGDGLNGYIDRMACYLDPVTNTQLEQLTK